MKTIGFIEDKDGRIVKPCFIEKLGYEVGSELPVSDEEKKKIINYLNSSERVFSITLALHDNDNYIGSYMIFSDGEWIWPNHLAYFLRKKKDEIDARFLNHLKNCDFKVRPLSEEQRKEVGIFIEGTLLNF